jgi:Resolvase, N terminal domain
MIYGYARVSTDGQSVDTEVRQLRAAGAQSVFREVASGARSDRAQLRRAIAQLEEGDVLLVMRLDPLARSTRDLLNTLAAITEKKAGFRSLGDAWADTTTPHGRFDAASGPPNATAIATAPSTLGSVRCSCASRSCGKAATYSAVSRTLTKRAAIRI